MGIDNVGDLSLGQWAASVTAWNKVHGATKAQPPTEEEFDLAVMRARGHA